MPQNLPTPLTIHVTPLRVTIVDAGKMLGISRARLYQLMNAGAIRAVKEGSRTLFTVAELERFSAASQALADARAKGRANGTPRQ